MPRPPSRDPSPRAIAARVLDRVENEGAYAAAALDAEMARLGELDPRDRALATELVYGVLRTRAVLGRELGKFMRRPFERTDPVVATHLLVAAYQLSFLDRVPAFAAIDSAVELARVARGPKLGGFVNAVLRKLANRKTPLDKATAIVESAPAWLVSRLERDVGVEEARALLGASEGAPLGSVCLRLREGRPVPAWLAGAEVGRACATARILRAEGDPRRHPEWRRGDVVVQEEGAQVVGLAVGARSGDRVLDACAGRGQKTALLVEALGPEGEVVATDVHAHKLEALAGELARLGLAVPTTRVADLSAGALDLPGPFDRVLVDAPCTGSGTLRRRPEIARRLEPTDPARLADLAERILRNAAASARPGGRVVFAVCSVFREEGEAVVERVSDILEPTPFDSPAIAGVVEPGATSFRLLPLRHGTDGYFVASFMRR
jgi:16S rRNA (cytosine967-C5)-methyltransferase